MSQDEGSRGSRDRRPLSLFEGWLRLREERRMLAEVRRPTSLSIVAVPSFFNQRYDVPYIPTSLKTAKKMLEIAEVRPRDVVYDLGCGDARLLILAVELFKAKKAVGYEIRKEVYKTALQEVETRNLAEKVTIVNGDLFNADLSEATVITLYLTYGANKKLKPKLEREARPGARIVSHDYEMPGWQPTRMERLRGDTIYLYTVPDPSRTTKIYKKLNKDLLRLQKIMHMNYLDLEKAFTHMNDKNCTIIDGKYVYRRGHRGKSTIISVWTKPLGEPGAKCLFNAPIAL